MNHQMQQIVSTLELDEDAALFLYESIPFAAIAEDHPLYPLYMLLADAMTASEGQLAITFTRPWYIGDDQGRRKLNGEFFNPEEKKHVEQVMSEGLDRIDQQLARGKQE